MSGGAEALAPLLHATRQHSRSSVWQLLNRSVLQPLGFPRVPLVRLEVDLALALIGVVVMVIVLSATRQRGATSTTTASAAIVGATMLVFLLAATYVLPWYSAWVLPVLALVWRSRVAVIAAGQAALMVIAYAAPVAVGGAFMVFARDVVPLLAGAGVAVVVWSAAKGVLDRPLGVPRRDVVAALAPRHADA